MNTEWILWCLGVISVGDSSLIQVIRRIISETVTAEKPCDYTFGIVVSEKPLKIKISNSLTIDSDFIDLARNVTDFETTVSILDDYGWKTQNRAGGTYDASFESHNHDIVISKKKIKVHNALKKGEKVLMIQKARGQKYTVIDRVVSE